LSDVNCRDLVPVPYQLISTHAETHDTWTLTLRPVGEPIPAHQPGQFTMLYAFGVGEIPISISGWPGSDDLVHTIRAVGAVSRALTSAEPGQLIGVRGPYGTDWGVPDAADQELLIVAGGIGLAPLRPAILQALREPGTYRKVTVLIGARSPEELVFARELTGWREAGARVRVTVDRAAPGWTGRVGVVTQLIDQTGMDPERTLALVCGPEVMIRHTARALVARQVPPERVRVSMERNMRCGVAVCGHCQLGPVLLCRDGAVLSYPQAAPLLAIKEL
jgi:NAD(P)H-flavin reductase